MRLNAMESERSARCLVFKRRDLVGFHLSDVALVPCFLGGSVISRGCGVRKKCILLAELNGEPITRVLVSRL